VFRGHFGKESGRQPEAEPAERLFDCNVAEPRNKQRHNDDDPALDASIERNILVDQSHG
jgi:hypothetical protein